MAVFVKNTTDAHICQEDTLGDNEVEHAEGDEVDILEGDEVECLEGDEVESLVDDEVESLEDDEVESLEVDEVESLEGDEVESLEVDEMKSLVDDEVESLEVDEVDSLEGDEVESLEVESLEIDEVESLEVDEVESLVDDEVENLEGDEVESLEGDEVESSEVDEMESSDIDEVDGEVVECLVEKMDHFGDEVEGLRDEIEGLVDEVENFGDDVESLGNDEVACSVVDDTEGIKNVQMEGKEQEFESTNEVSYSPVNLSAVTDNECSKEDAVNDHESDTTLHFVDCVVQDDEKSDSFVALSCLEAGLHALHWRFPHLKQVILQSDNAINLSGKDMKMFVHQAVSSTGMELLAYYHNEAAAGKDVCDTHFAHQQARVDAYISEGDGGRKVSTAKQLAVALSTKSVKNTIVLLVKPKQEKKRKYSAAVEDRRASFTPFVVSVDGVLGHNAQHLMKRLCDQIAVKWEKSHSEVMGWVRARMAFAILRATNLCLRGSRV